MSKQLRASLLIILSASCYGLLGFFGTKIILLNLSLATMLFWRFFIAAIWMIPLKSKRSYSANPSLTLTLFHIVCFSGSAIFYFIATRYIGTGIAMVIYFSYPVFVFLFAFLIDGKRLSLATIATLFIIAFGLVLLKGHSKDDLNLLGIGAALLTAIFYAIYVFANRNDHHQNLNSRLQSFLLCLGCSIIFLIISLSLNEFTVPKTLETWLYILGIGIVSTALPIQLMLEGMKFTTAGNAAILTVFEPIITFILGIALLHEIVSNTQVIGAIVVLGSVIIYQLTAKKQTDKKSMPQYLRFRHSWLDGKGPNITLSSANKNDPILDIEGTKG